MRKDDFVTVNPASPKPGDLAAALAGEEEQLYDASIWIPVFLRAVPHDAKFIVGKYAGTR
ncbi:hypothetical protein [Bauldia sp.]|uniref:hypothetical protein n=1 Tax=Bauldia sp. TaxID=2575872 RepID=UPI003BA8F268